MDLKKTIERIIEESLGNNSKGLRNIANAEKILKQAYEGRYFFELIQNVRDANREIDINGAVYIEILDDKLIIANTGAEFSEQGIESITNIGDSTRNSREFIGHKGIGFKSILEITETPIICTRYGTVFFSREQSISQYRAQIGKEKKSIPLFFFPHFKSDSLNTNKEDIVTKIELPYKSGIDEGVKYFV